MNKFEVGQRVACYNHAKRYVGRIIEFDHRYGPDVVIVDIDKPEMDTMSFNVKQLRRIKPRKKLREFWINVYSDDMGYSHSSKERADAYQANRTECIHMREVRK